MCADVLNPAATAGTWVTIDGMDNSGEGELCGIPEYGRRTSAWQPVLVVYERVLATAPDTAPKPRKSTRTLHAEIFGSSDSDLPSEDDN